MSLANNLKEARVNKGYTQEELAKLIGKSKNVISNWERGDNKPDADTLFDLCDILNVDANYLLGWEDNQNLSLSIKEQEHIKKYRSLNSTDKETVDILVDRLCVREKEAEYDYAHAPKYIDLYPRLASAGTGQYLFDDIPAEKIQVDWDSDADFAIGVSGDSMEPTYYDGDILLVMKQDSIRIGEIGIFIVDGNSYVKEYQKDRLVSHNDQYKDIEFTEYTEAKCVGKVVGQIHRIY